MALRNSPTLLAFLVLAIALVACGAGQPAISPTTAPTAASAGNSSAASRPAWQSIPFTNVRTNQPIRLAEFAGKTVVVEAIAVWCTNCLAQQRRVIEALPRLAQDMVVYISLGIDASEDIPLLADYAKKNNFTWTIGISNKDFTNALIAQFGRTITNPPSVPLFIISPSGATSQLYTGAHSPDELLKLVEENSKA